MDTQSWLYVSFSVYIGIKLTSGKKLEVCTCIHKVTKHAHILESYKWYGGLCTVIPYTVKLVLAVTSVKRSSVVCGKF